MVHGIKGTVLVGVLTGAAGGFAASMMVGTPTVAQPSEPTTVQVVRAHEFQLVDVKGRTRGKLAFSANEQPYLQLKDENDISGVWVGIAQETGVTVKDLDGRTRLVLSVDREGSPSLVVRNRERQARSFKP